MFGASTVSSVTARCAAQYVANCQIQTPRAREVGMGELTKEQWDAYMEKVESLTTPGLFVPQDLYAALVEDKRRLDALLERGMVRTPKPGGGMAVWCRTRAEIDEVLGEEKPDGKS